MNARLTLSVLLALISWAFGCASASPQQVTPAAQAESSSAACLEGGQPTCMEAAAFYRGRPTTPETKRHLAALYYRACLQGDAEACGVAAEMYAAGEVRPPGRRRARAMFEHVCRNRFPFDPGACTAGALHGRACEGGRASSCAALAELYEVGRLGKRRPNLVGQLHRRACAAGHAGSCQRVAEQTMDRDPAGAAKLLRVGCDLGHVLQCVALADLFERGVGVARDLPRARALRNAACEAKHGGACRSLAQMWHRGVGGQRALTNARTFYERGCELDDADACLALARAHAAGTFGEADMAKHYELSGKAAKIYEPACEAQDAHACHVLGGLHRLGGGVREDRTLGLALQRRACEAGLGSACVAFLTRGPHRVSIQATPKLARAVTDACRDGDGDACFAVGWIGATDLAAAGVDPPAHPFSRGCRLGDAAACNAHGMALVPPSRAGLASLETACALGYAPGCHHLGLAKEMEADVDGDERAVGAYARACALGWPNACTRLGMMRRQGHVTPGAMPARAAFDRGCRGGDVVGCYELGLLVRSQPGSDPKVWMGLLGRACNKGHAASCAELGRQLLASGAERRTEALTQLGAACDAGGFRACIALSSTLADGGDTARRTELLTRAVTGATRACDQGLSACGGGGVSRVAAARWSTYEDVPARELVAPPACGIALERACVVARDAHVARCEGFETACFEGGAEIRRLASAGLSISVADAERVEKLGFLAAEKACRKNDAAACAQLATAYRQGRGVAADDKKAKRFDARACQLDKARCP